MPLRPPPATTRPATLLAALLLGLLPLSPALGDESGTAPKAADPLLVGTFPVTVEQVVDGDTLRLPDGQPSVRVLAIDCEEVFKKERDRKAAEKDFAAYAKAKRGDRPRPVKYGTPAGEAARAFVQDLVRGATSMRLERDGRNAQRKGMFGRLLAHVILQTPQGEVNLAEAVIRAGHSPYFTKYGRSLRMDGLLRRAEQEARKAQRGIWSSEGPGHYPDYAERLRWWNARAQQVDRWRRVAAKPDHVTLGAANAEAKLRSLVGKPAVIFGLYDRELRVKGGDKRIFMLSGESRRGFALVFFDLEACKGLDLEAMDARYVTVRGTVTLYKDRPQMVLERADQVSTE